MRRGTGIGTSKGGFCRWRWKRLCSGTVQGKGWDRNCADRGELEGLVLLVFQESLALVRRTARLSLHVVVDAI